MSDNQDDDLFPPLEIEEGTESEAPDVEAKAEAQPEPAPEPAPEPDEAEKTVPLGALKSLRDENKSLKARLAEVDQIKAQLQQMQQPREPMRPDDPEFVPTLAQMVEARIINEKLATSRFLAEREFGAELVAEAYEYFDQHPQESQQFLAEASPFHAAVNYYRRMKAAQEIGPDPAGYRERLEAEIRQKILAEQAAQNIQPSRGPSLATQPNLGSRQGLDWNGPTPLEDILK